MTASADGPGAARRSTVSDGGLGAAARRSTLSDGSASGSPGPARQIRVLLADDHPVVRAGLRGMLATEPDIEVVAEAGSGPEAVAVASRTAVDVVLMDLRMPDGDGVTATAAIAALAPPSAAAAADPGTAAPGAPSPADPGVPRVLVLTTYDEDADILRAVEAGATGYLLKDATKQELADAIRAAARGETVLAPAVAGRLITRLRRSPAPDLPQLSARETEILIRAARGMTNAEISRDLFIGEATVKTHLLRASTKLGVSGRTAAVAAATERGLLRRPAG